MDDATQPPAQPQVPFDLQRMQRYFEWCDAFRCKPVPEASVVFRHAQCRTLTVQNVTLLELMAICEMLRYDNVIHTLDCSGAKIGDSGAVVIAEMLALATCLRELRLATCGITDAGATVLFRAVQQAPVLQRLIMSGNEIGPAGSVALSKVLKRTRTLCYVDVANCRLQRGGVAEISHALIGRAQKRLDKTRRHQLNAGANGQAADAASGNAEGGRSRAASTEDIGEHPAASLDMGRPYAWGLLFGDVSELVVTTDAAVKTIWKSGPMADAQGTADHAKPSVAHAPGPGGHPAAPPGHVEDDLDIEVRIAGNFVLEEIVNASIHGIGFIGAVLGTIPLLRVSQTAEHSWRTFGSVVYLLTLLGFFASATINHALFMIDNVLFRVLDHSAAFALIAGTYTPFLMTNLSFHPLGWGLLVVVWLLALVGITVSSMCRASIFQKRLRLILYGLMGWLAIIPWVLVRSCVKTEGWRLLAGGGLAFTLGIILYMRERRAAATIWSYWYILVLLSSAAHYMAVYSYVEPPTAACLADAASHGLGQESVVGLGASPPVGVPGQLGFQVGAASRNLGEALEAVRQAAAWAAAGGQRAMVVGMRDLLKETLEMLEQAGVPEEL